MLINLFAAQATDSTNKADIYLKEFAHDMASGQGVDRIGQLIDQLIQWSLSIGGRIIAAIVIFTIGKYAIKLILKFADRLLTTRRIEPSIRSFVHSFVSTLLMVVLIMAVINKLGIETTSIAALLASFGVAVGMAMSGNLSNFVGGILILLFKPYKVGNWIHTNDTLGQVVSIEMFHTVLRTYEGSYVYLSNGSMSTAKIKNYSKEANLRVQFELGLTYGTDLNKAQEILMRIAANDPRVLSDPKPSVALEGFADSSLSVVFRVWTKRENYWAVKYEFNRKIYDTFNAEGVDFAFPQITVHQA